MTRTCTAGGLTWLLLLAAAPLKAQQDAVAEARERYDVGERHFEQGDYASALGEFERVEALLAGHPSQHEAA